MAELIIDSVPQGAQVQINGEIVGTTPMALQVDGEVSLAEFRAECFDAGGIGCSWDVMKTRLEDRTVSQLWWDMTEMERRSIAEMAIKNTLFYTLRYGRSGKPDCEGGVGDVMGIVCVQNGSIRALKFGSYSVGGDSCYYRRSSTSGEFCYVPEIQYGLPCHMVTCTTYAGVDRGFGHTICSIQVVDKTDSLDNWILFQYADFDIKPGNWQIPADEYDLCIKISRLIGLSCWSNTCETIARFEHL